MTTIKEGRKGTDIFQIGTTINVGPSVGTGFIRRLPNPQGSPDIYSDIVFNGSAQTFGPFDEVSIFEFRCTTGELSYTASPIVGYQPQPKYTATVNDLKPKTKVFVPAGSKIAISGASAVGMITRVSTAGSSEQAPPILFNGTSVEYGPFSTDTAFQIEATFGQISATTSFVQMPSQPVLTISATVFDTAAVAGTVIADISNVPFGSVPSIYPRDGRFLIAGNAASGWKIVRGMTFANSDIDIRITAAGAKSVSATLKALTAPIPVALTAPTIAADGGVFRIGIPIVATIGIYTNTQYEPFQLFSNFDVGDSPAGPWRQQGVFDGRYTPPATEKNGTSIIGKYVRYRELPSNAFGTGLVASISNVLGPIADSLVPGNIIPYDDVASINAGNIQSGVPFDFPVRYGQAGWAVAVTNVDGSPISGLTGGITGGADSSTARFAGTWIGQGYKLVKFTCTKPGETPRENIWGFLLDSIKFVSMTNEVFSGSLYYDKNTPVSMFNQSARTSKALTIAPGSEGQNVYRTFIDKGGAGWNVDTGNKYRSEIQINEFFRAEEEFFLYLRNRNDEFTFPDIADTVGYAILAQGHHLPPVGAAFVPPWWAIKGVTDGGVQKLIIETAWNNDVGVFNYDIYDNAAHTDSADLRLLKFSSPKNIRNGYAIENNPGATGVPAGTFVVSGGGTDVMQVVVNQDIPAGNRQIKIKTNYHRETFGPFVMPTDWHKLTIRQKPSLQGNGIFQVKLDGVTIVDVANKNLGYSDDGELDPDGVSRPLRYYNKAGIYYSPKGGTDGYHMFDYIVSRVAVPALEARPANPFLQTSYRLIDGYNDGGYTAKKTEGAASISVQANGATGGHSPTVGPRTASALASRSVKDIGIMTAWVYNFDYNGLAKISLELGRDGTATAAGAAIVNPSLGGAVANELQLTGLPGGEWYPLSINTADYAALDTTPGKISHRYRTSASGGQDAGSAFGALFDQLVEVDNYKPFNCFTFDDMENTHRTFVGPLMKEFNAPWQFFFNQNVNTNNRMTTAQVADLYNNFNADVGCDAREDGNTVSYAVKLGRAAGKTDEQIYQDILQNFRNMQAWLRANIGNGQDVRGMEHACYAGSEASFYPNTDWINEGKRPLPTLVSDLVTTAGSAVVKRTGDVAFPAGVGFVEGAAVYTVGSGGTATVLRRIAVGGISADRLTITLDGPLPTTGTFRGRFVDDTDAFTIGKIQARMRSEGLIKTWRLGPAYSTDSGFHCSQGFGGYDLMMPAASLSGLHPDNVGAMITKMRDANSRGRSMVFYGHRSDAAISAGQGINFHPDALRSLVAAAAEDQAAGKSRIGTQRLMWDAAGGRGPNIPSFVV